MNNKQITIKGYTKTISFFKKNVMINKILVNAIDKNYVLINEFNESIGFNKVWDESPFNLDDFLKDKSIYTIEIYTKETDPLIYRKLHLKNHIQKIFLIIQDLNYCLNIKQPAKAKYMFQEIYKPLMIFEKFKYLIDNFRVPIDDLKIPKQLDEKQSNDNNNFLKEFLTDFCILTDNFNDKIGAKVLYNKYTEYYYNKTNSFGNINPNKFSEITMNLLNKKRFNNGNFYTNIKFKNI
jgi:hypothetical protein